MSVQLDLEDLTKTFGGLVAVNGVTFTVSQGEVVGVLGPNGSGKTTVLNMISGALPATSGKAMFQGRDLTALTPDKIARLGVARTFQLVRPLPSLSVRDNVLVSLAFGRNRHWGREAKDLAEEHLAFVGLAGRGDEQVENLTYIDQKRMELARALASEPSVLLLDEWLAGLNPSELKVGIDLIAHLQGAGITIMLVEHIMEAVRELCTRCVVMNAGTVIADGETHRVLKEPAVIEAYLGAEHA